MAITAFEEIANSANGNMDQEGVRTYQYAFQILTDSDDDGPATILTHSSCPQIFSSYYRSSTDYDLGAKCIGLDPQRSAEFQRKWTLTARYSSKYKDPAGNNENPLLRPTKWSGGSVDFQEVLETDAINTDVAIVNSAFQPFDPPIMVDRSRDSFQGIKNYSTFDMYVTGQFCNTVNSAIFKGYFPIGTVKCKGRTWDEVNEGGYFYYAVTWQFEFRYDGWPIAPLDQGTMELIADEPRVILDERTAAPVSKPVLLNGAGGRLDVSTEDPVYLLFNGYRQMNFNLLGL